MIRITRFNKDTATEAHEGTILASPVFQRNSDCPIGHAYGYLDRKGACMDAHSHPTQEYYIVLQGKGLVEVDEELQEVTAGDVIEIPRNAMHSMHCCEDKPFIWVAFWWN